MESSSSAIVAARLALSTTPEQKHSMEDIPKSVYSRKSRMVGITILDTGTLCDKCDAKYRNLIERFMTKEKG